MPVKFKILVVEDDAMCAKLIQIYLESSGYAVSERLTTGEGAIKTVEKIKPDVIFMDIMLAGKIDGIEASKEIKRKCPDVMIIFASAYDDVDTVSSAMQLCPLAFIDKPYGYEDIQAAMQMAENVFETKVQNSLINIKEAVY